MSAGGRLTISGCRQDDQVEVTITDTGPGISAEHLERVMQPLFTTKPRGIGLGLALARGILAKNHGRLELASEVGRGSTFTVCLPAAQNKESS
jgi:signal transduction histidine kinase